MDDSEAAQCIICMEELESAPQLVVVQSPNHDVREVAAQPPPPPKPQTAHPGTIPTTNNIALIKPCGHILHDDCLRQWAEKANSCPLCRTPFNLVEILDKIGGTVQSEYEVEDKKQVAEFDASAFIDEFEEEEEVRPCPICDQSDQEEILLLCDGCDAPYHTHCIGLDRVPDGSWFCMECRPGYINNGEAEEEESVSPIPGRHAPRTLASVRRTRQRERTDAHYGAWHAFNSRVYDITGLDLDFGDDEDHSMDAYRAHQRRQRDAEIWQRRLNIATRQGARNAFRTSAPRPPSRAIPERRRVPASRPRTPAETVEATAAWRDFERAKDMDTQSPRSRKRKSRSTTASPANRSPREPAEPERKLKRPRTRRVLDRPESSAAPSRAVNPVRRPTSSSSNRRPATPTIRTTANSNPEPPSFLANLMKEIEQGTVSDDDTLRSGFTSSSSANAFRVTSPSLEFSSPATSPASSTSYHTPRASSITPPPHISKRPGSPYSLTSRVEPVFPHADYSPNVNRSATEDEFDQQTPRANSTSYVELRQPRPRRQGPPLPRSKEVSPTGTAIPQEAKESISKIVKIALGPYWKASKITKDQYTTINRDVSRKLYEIVEIRDLSDEKQKSAWEKMATKDVATAVEALRA